MKLVPFSFENLPVRVADKEGEPWFVAADVCKALGLADVSDAVKKLDEDERASIPVIDAIGRKQGTLIVSESGLYALVLRCRDAMTAGSPAHRFRKWVTSDVLPAIRKTRVWRACGAQTLNSPRGALVDNRCCVVARVQSNSPGQQWPGFSVLWLKKVDALVS